MQAYASSPPVKKQTSISAWPSGQKVAQNEWFLIDGYFQTGRADIWGKLVQVLWQQSLAP
jgi:hypothetical protein